MHFLWIVDQNGKLVVKYKYDVYGNSKRIEDTSGIGMGNYNPFRYKGYYYDDDTDMYYCKLRFYVPRWRRWLKCALCVGTSALVLFRKLYKENNMISNQNK